VQIYLKNCLISFLCIFLAACVAPEAPDIQEFEIVESSDPCWVIKSPDKCKSLKKKYPNTFLFKGKIITNKKLDHPDKDKELSDKLQNETSLLYLKFFQDKLKDSFLNSEGCNNQNNANLCQQIFFTHTRLNSSELLSKRFKFIDNYYKENGKKWNLFGLCMIPEHEQMFSQIIDMMFIEYETAKEEEQEKSKSKNNPDIKWFNQ